MSLSYFTAASVETGSLATSQIDSSALVTAIQNQGSDTYFDSTNEVNQVYVYYTHEDGRQEKRIFHSGSPLQGTVSWTDNAKDGAWEKDRVRVVNHEGASATLLRADIGTGEDTTKAGTTITLNES